jgi:uncharacterized protein YkwD
MGHPPHRAILLGDFDLIGVGRAVARDGMTYWVADVDFL